MRPPPCHFYILGARRSRCKLNLANLRAQLSGEALAPHRAEAECASHHYGGGGLVAGGCDRVVAVGIGNEPGLRRRAARHDHGALRRTRAVQHGGAAAATAVAETAERREITHPGGHTPDASGSIRRRLRHEPRRKSRASRTSIRGRSASAARRSLAEGITRQRRRDRTPHGSAKVKGRAHVAMRFDSLDPARRANSATPMRTAAVGTHRQPRQRRRMRSNRRAGSRRRDDRRVGR